MNYIDHIIDKGVPTPQLSVYREITKPYTRLSDSSGSTTEAPTRTEQMLEDSNSSLSFVSCIHDTITDESPSFSRKVSKQKEDRPPTIAMWGWDSGLLDSAEDDEKDIWDEIFHSNRRQHVQSSSVIHDKETPTQQEKIIDFQMQFSGHFR